RRRMTAWASSNGAAPNRSQASGVFGGRRVEASRTRALRPPLSGGRIGSSQLHEADLAVRALLPDVPDVIDGGAVALLVEGDVAEDGVERRPGVHGGGDLLRIERVRLFRRLLDDLHRRVGIEGVALRVEPFGLERRDRVLRVRVVSGLGAEGHQRPLDAGAADRREFAVGDAVAGDHHRLHALVAHLADDQAALGVQAAPHQIVGARFLDLGDDGGIVLLAGVDAFVEHFLDAELVHVFERRVGEALAVSGLVVDHRDLLALELVAGELGPNQALLVVAAADAERVPELAVGDLGIGRRGGGEQDAVLGIDVGSGDRHARVEMADHELDAVADEFVGDRHALLGIRNIVADLYLDCLPQNAAGLVDVRGRLLDALHELSPEG